MSNGGRDLNVASETEKSLAVALIGLAGAVFGGLIAALPSVVSSLNDSGAELAIIVSVAILVLLVVSMIFGGRGYAYGPGRVDLGDRFNLQALFGAIALCLLLVLAVVIYLTVEPSPNKKIIALELTLTI